ncbi:MULTISPECIES: type I polyketide synthase [unclassified Okeania]|uniref:type I polyketide synthase n=1 Tax=unclassified Okeania TaxID=2634635 RepID=UPI0013B913E4|nr:MULTISPECIES: type I polyketide synthase [unclassified Okeania]NES79642.1 type I polyketide synthase [Okeania sp. SIO1H4]NET23298.1 type I polyketide synthase [Okeania sp. SIO1H5]NET96960.1 type I polyketide synthase [Okeania sp. SIO1H2]
MKTLSKNIEELTPLQRAFLVIEELQSKIDALEKLPKEPIAIIGIGCRYPGGASTPETFWNLLQQGVDAITEIPKDRWNIDDYYDPDPETPGKIYTRYGGFIGQLQEFDSSFFGISAKEANYLDPQQRLLLEVVWESLENAAVNPQKLAKTQTGVFLGIGGSDYTQIASCDLEKINAYFASGNTQSTASGRVSYILGTTGPNLAVDTACSSSLVSFHLACSSLRNQESDLALAGGVNRIIAPLIHINHSRSRMLSADGRCKTFDASADGFVRSEGCGIVVLKRLSDAVADGDNILAIVRGTAINQDGHTSGLTVPNGLSQQAVIRKALKNGGVEPAHVSYVEAHGTGTSLGDPIEVGALAAVFGETHSQEQPLIIGSLKTNIGHTEAAAGIAGLIKVVLQMQHKQIAPHLHFNLPSPYINWSEFPAHVPTQVIPWQVGEKSRVAGVSSFGFSGTNAHVVLEEAPAEEKTEEILELPVQLLTLSAKTDSALTELVARYIRHLETHKEQTLADICYTAQTGRAHFHHCLAVVGTNKEELAAKLQQYQAGKETAFLYSQANSPSSSTPKIAFLFTGQGSQYINMGRKLYDQAPVFRESIDRCSEILNSQLENPLLEILYPQTNVDSKPSLLDQTVYTQPALFAIEYALAKLWQSWGIKPDVVMGHSLGEYVAATVAGIWSLEAALKLVTARAKLIQKLPKGGEMVSVMASIDKVIATVNPHKEKVGIAAINGPASVVISGSSLEVNQIVYKLESQGIKTKKLIVSHAFHSPLMEPILGDIETLVNQVKINQPQIPIISNLTGTIADNRITSAKYWVDHTRQPVKFASAIENLHKSGYEICLEIGPKPILLGMARQCLPESRGVWLPSLRPGVDEWQSMLSSVGQLYVQEIKIDWLQLGNKLRKKKVVLPNYPFQRQRYWISNTAKKDKGLNQEAKLHPLVHKKLQSPLCPQIFFESCFSTSLLPFLLDHRIYQEVVVPGACHISTLLTTASFLFSNQQCKLEDIFFPQALALNEKAERTLQVVLTPEKMGYSLEVISFEPSLNDQIDSNFAGSERNDNWSIHAQGKILPSTEISPSTSLEKFQTCCTQPIDNKQIYEALAQRKIELGNTFRWFKQIWKGEGEILGLLQVPEVLQDVQEYQLHPTLIDSIFQLLGGAIDDQLDRDYETFVPFRIGEFIFYDVPDSNQVWCHADLKKNEGTSLESFKANIELFTASGKILAKVIDFEVRKANQKVLLQTLQSDIKDWLYQINWQPKSLEIKQEAFSTTHRKKRLIFVASVRVEEEVMLAMEEQLQQKDCVFIFPSSGYQKLDEQHYQIDPSQVQDFQRLLQDASNIDEIIYLWTVLPSHEPSNLEKVEKAQNLCLQSLLYLVQALTASSNNNLPSLWLVTMGTQNVLEAREVVQPELATLWGLGRVLALEHPEIDCRLVDLEYGSEENIHDILKPLIQELLSPERENQIAYRQELRYVSRLVKQPKRQEQQANGNLEPQLPQENSKRIFLEPNASYLIVGGLGDLGLETASWLANNGAKHLVLVSRKQPSSNVREKIEKLETTGVEVRVVNGDISKEEDVAKIIEQFQENHQLDNSFSSPKLPPLKGVIHAAGVLEDGMVSDLNWNQFTKVMKPKIQGSWHLHQLTQHIPLDFFVYFSSAASLLGNLGQANYAAANAFMDALAHYRRGMGLPALSINWGPWSQEGMASRLNSHHQQRMRSQGITPLNNEEGLQALTELLTNQAIQVGVFPINWSRFISQMHDEAFWPLLEEIKSLVQLSSPKSTFLMELKEKPIKQWQNLLVTYVCQQVAQVMGLDNWEQIGLQQGLFDLGLDSLMAMDLRNSLQRNLDHAFTSTFIFNYPTVEKIVNYIMKEVLLYSDEVGESVLEVDNLNEQLENVSKDEILELLSDELSLEDGCK